MKLLKSDKNSDCNDIINGCRIDNQIVKFKIIDCSKEENNCYNIKEYPVLKRISKTSLSLVSPSTILIF